MDNEILISEVFKRKPLWDTRCNNYCKRELVKKLWSEVANILQCDRELVKKRWKNLRDNYRTELKKVKEKTKGTQWMYFESMDFLRDVLESRHVKANQTFQETDDTSSYQLQDTTSNDNMSNTENSSNQAQTSFSRASQKRKYNIEENEFFQIESERCKPYREQNYITYDSDYNFLISFLPHLENMSQINSFKFKIEATKLLMQIKQSEEKIKQKTPSTNVISPVLPPLCWIPLH